MTVVAKTAVNKLFISKSICLQASMYTFLETTTDSFIVTGIIIALFVYFYFVIECGYAGGSRYSDCSDYSDCNDHSYRGDRSDRSDRNDRESVTSASHPVVDEPLTYYALTVSDFSNMRDPQVNIVTYSKSAEDIYETLATVAVKDALGGVPDDAYGVTPSDLVYCIDGDELESIPPESFLSWDECEDEDENLDNGTVGKFARVVASISFYEPYDATAHTSLLDRACIKRYAIHCVSECVQEYLNTHTEADREYERVLGEDWTEHDHMKE